MKVFKIDYVAVILFLAGLILICSVCFAEEKKMQERFLKIHFTDVKIEHWKTDDANRLDIKIGDDVIFSIDPIADNRVDHEIFLTEKALESMTLEEFDTMQIYGLER